MAIQRQPSPGTGTSRPGRALGRAPDDATSAGERLARGLGWFSIGIGLTALAAAFTSPRARRGRLAAATAAVAGVSVLGARRLGRGGGAATTDTPNGVRLRTAITINRSPDEVYRFWRNFTNLARVMRHVESVEVRDERRSHWVVRAPGGMRLEWDSEVMEDRPGERIAWRSLPGGDVRTQGAVQFILAPAGRGTEVHLGVEYDSSGGLMGATVGRFFGGTASAFASEDLRPLKQLLETGEVVTR